jgi:hypothetical protein
MKRFGIAIGVCTLLLLACTGMPDQYVRLETVEVSEDTDRYTYSADIPQIYGLKDAGTERAINERLQVIPERQKRMFVRDVNNLSAVQTGSTIKSNLTIDYKDGRSDEHVVSVLYVVSPYLFDAAHPNHFTIPYNYDVTAKKEIAFEDVFTDSALPDLSAMISRSLIEQSKVTGTHSDAKEQFVREGAAANADNFRSFTLRRNGIDFYFDPYQVGPYTEGLIKVSYSGGTLEALLSDKGKQLMSTD